jgi:hypothetical protein
LFAYLEQPNFLAALQRGADATDPDRAFWGKPHFASNDRSEDGLGQGLCHLIATLKGML